MSFEQWCALARSRHLNNAATLVKKRAPPPENSSVFGDTFEAEDFSREGGVMEVYMVPRDLLTNSQLLNGSKVPFATRMQLLGSLNSCRITHSCTHTSDAGSLDVHKYRDPTPMLNRS